MGKKNKKSKKSGSHKERARKLRKLLKHLKKKSSSSSSTSSDSSSSSSDIRGASRIKRTLKRRMQRIAQKQKKVKLQSIELQLDQLEVSTQEAEAALELQKAKSASKTPPWHNQPLPPPPKSVMSKQFGVNPPPPAFKANIPLPAALPSKPKQPPPLPPPPPPPPKVPQSPPNVPDDGETTTMKRKASDAGATDTGPKYARNDTPSWGTFPAKPPPCPPPKMIPAIGSFPAKKFCYYCNEFTLAWFLHHCIEFY